jgi:hypothetical protein
MIFHLQNYISTYNNIYTGAEIILPIILNITDNFDDFINSQSPIDESNPINIINFEEYNIGSVKQTFYFDYSKHTLALESIIQICHDYQIWLNYNKGSYNNAIIDFRLFIYSGKNRFCNNKTVNELITIVDKEL